MSSGESCPIIHSSVPSTYLAWHREGFQQEKGTQRGGLMPSFLTQPEATCVGLPFHSHSWELSHLRPVHLSHTNYWPTETRKHFSENPKWDSKGVKSKCPQARYSPPSTSGFHTHFKAPRLRVCYLYFCASFSGVCKMST